MKFTDLWSVRPLPAPGAVVQGVGYRITVLTDRLLRLEYDAENHFRDCATQLAICRAFPLPEFTVTERDGWLVVETHAVRLEYNRKPFSSAGLSVSLKGAFSTYASIWHYGDAPDTLKGTACTLDEADGAIALDDGLMSLKGYAALHDENTMGIGEQGELLPATPGGIDLYLFAYGHDYAGCLRDFMRLSGKTPPLPRYALGNWWSRFYPYTEESYKALIERFEAEQVPLSVSVLDMNWHVTDIDPSFGPGWTGYTWNREMFPNPARMLRWLHGKGLRVTLNDHPADGVRACEEMYPEMARAMGVDPASKQPVIFDAANPQFLRALEKCVLEPYEEMGVDFWWIDWQQKGGSSVEGVDPLFTLNHTRYLHALARGNKGAMTFSRYAGPGSHRYPIGFSGDTLATWASLAFLPYFTATASNIGYGWWSHDIGGHMHGIRDDELAVRWLQFGVFSPIMRLHASPSDFMRKEPWTYSARACEIMKGYLRLRHRLLPWLYTQNLLASEQLAAFLRPVYYDYPNQYAAYAHPETQYLLGDGMIVSAITAPEDSDMHLAATEAWLPEGIWTDFFTGWRYEGGRSLRLHRPMEQFPVLVKAGSMIPMNGDAALPHGTALPERILLRAFPGAEGSAALIEDDESMPGSDGYRRVETRFEMHCSQGLRLEIHAAQGDSSLLPANRRYTVEVNGAGNIAPDSASCGHQLRWDAKRRALCVELEADAAEGAWLEWHDFPACPAFDRVDAVKEALMPARMAHDEKDCIMGIVAGRSNPADMLAELHMLDLPAALMGALAEILTVC